MQENKLLLDFYGVGVEIKSHSSLILDYLRSDFNYFTVASLKNEPIIYVELTSEPLNLKKGIRLFKANGAKVYGFWRRRVCDYGDCVAVLENKRLRISSAQLDRLYEISYLALLSVIGEELDKRGFHRVHALAYESAGKAVLMPMDSGRGKSTRALKLLNEGYKIYSDESPLVKEGFVYPFPTRIALLEDSLQQVLKKEELRIHARRGYRKKWLLPILNEQVALPSEIANEPGFFLLLKTMVVGYGLAQMAEFMVRGDNFLVIIKIAFSRLREVLGISFKLGEKWKSKSDIILTKIK